MQSKLSEDTRVKFAHWSAFNNFGVFFNGKIG